MKILVIRPKIRPLPVNCISHTLNNFSYVFCSHFGPQGQIVNEQLHGLWAILKN
jgi:hypothetical protein